MRASPAESASRDADSSDFVPKQLHITPTPAYPPYLLGRYLNVKNAVATYLADRGTGRRITTGRVVRAPKDRDGPRGLNIPAMLDVLGLGAFSGRQHSGIDVSAPSFPFHFPLDAPSLSSPSAPRLPRANSLQRR